MMRLVDGLMFLESVRAVPRLQMEGTAFLAQNLIRMTKVAISIAHILIIIKIGITLIIIRKTRLQRKIKKNCSFILKVRVEPPSTGQKMSLRS